MIKFTSKEVESLKVLLTHSKDVLKLYLSDKECNEKYPHSSNLLKSRLEDCESLINKLKNENR